ncbi:MAG: hypothetical protein AVDCRST_MAG11-2011, partial [uncultured Gemmatimonadaceae bacterium]
ASSSHPHPRRLCVRRRWRGRVERVGLLRPRPCGARRRSRAGVPFGGRDRERRRAGGPGDGAGGRAGAGGRVRVARHQREHARLDRGSGGSDELHGSASPRRPRDGDVLRLRAHEHRTAAREQLRGHAQPRVRGAAGRHREGGARHPRVGHRAPAERERRPHRLHHDRAAREAREPARGRAGGGRHAV